MFTYLKNIISGKNGTFYDTFRVPHLRLRELTSYLPPPSDELQGIFHQRFVSYLDGACEFSHALFYGFSGRPAVFSDDELSGIGVVNGEGVYGLFVVCLIRFSLINEREVADSFCALCRLVFSENVVPYVDRLASALRTTDREEAERNIISVLRPILPSVANNPATRIRFVYYLSLFAGVLNKQTLNAISRGV